jgi:hypothetical protein
MKVGDQMVVNLGNFEVGMATIEDISDGKATILIPATRVVMAVKQSLAPLNPEVDRVFGGLETTGGNESDASEAVNTQVQAPAEPVSLREMQLDDTAVDRVPVEDVKAQEPAPEAQN